MRRREFIGVVGSAVAWPFAARAQQGAMSVIGLLNGVSNESYANRISAIRQGLQEVGYVEGRNVLIEYRSADGQYDRLSAMAAELTRLPVAVIVAIGGTPSARAAKAATTTIPIVFAVGSDVVELGLVKSLNRPEGNLTGMSLQNAVLTPKRLELLCKLVPGTGSIGALLNPAAANFEIDSRDLPKAAHELGRELVVLKAGSYSEIEAAFAAASLQRITALVVQNDAELNSSRDQIVRLAARNAIPTMYGESEAVRAGGLISYTVKFDVMFRQAGLYTGRILKGEKPADLPVMQPTKFDLVINLKTAKALSITVSPSLIAIADEIIE